MESVISMRNAVSMVLPIQDMGFIAFPGCQPEPFG